MFPGSFDPLTVAHVAVAEAAVETLSLDRIELSVSRAALGKPHLDGSVEDRVAELRAAVAARPGWGVAVTTSRLLADVADGFDAVVLGADKLAQVLDPKWYDEDPAKQREARDAALRRLPTVAVAARAGHELDHLLEQAADLGPATLEMVVLELPHHLHEVSASAVRGGRDDWRADT